MALTQHEHDATEIAPPQERLLDAATFLFSETGYEATSVRDIVAVARTNLNAVNYYFGSKQGLYLEVLRREVHRDRQVRTAPQSPFADPGPTALPEERLGILVHRLLATFINPDSKLPRLSALEILSPSPVFDQLAPILHDSEQGLLHDIVTALLRKSGVEPDTALVQRCVRSVLSQCTHFMFMRQVLPRVEPALVANDAAVLALAQHVTAFSVAALKNFWAEGSIKKEGV